MHIYMSFKETMDGYKQQFSI